MDKCSYTSAQRVADSAEGELGLLALEVLGAAEALRLRGEELAASEVEDEGLGGALVLGGEREVEVEGEGGRAKRALGVELKEGDQTNRSD